MYTVALSQLHVPHVSVRVPVSPVWILHNSLLTAVSMATRPVKSLLEEPPRRSVLILQLLEHHQVGREVRASLLQASRNPVM